MDTTFCGREERNSTNEAFQHIAPKKKSRAGFGAPLLFSSTMPPIIKYSVRLTRMISNNPKGQQRWKGMFERPAWRSFLKPGHGLENRQLNHLTTQLAAGAGQQRVLCRRATLAAGHEVTPTDQLSNVTQGQRHQGERALWSLPCLHQGDMSSPFDGITQAASAFFTSCDANVDAASLLC